jgi:large-conductance mechanosensitive channel
MIFATVTTSCSDDFVDRPVQYSIDSENYFNSKSDYENALIATYDLLNSTFINVLMVALIILLLEVIAQRCYRISTN